MYIFQVYEKLIKKIIGPQTGITVAKWSTLLNIEANKVSYMSIFLGYCNNITYFRLQIGNKCLFYVKACSRLHANRFALESRVS